MKKILVNSQAREKILSGCKKIADIVRLTIGPRGRNVLIERENGEPLITNDGVTIAREVSFECPFENIGARVLREASVKTNSAAGDGTTTAVVLAAEIIEKGARRIVLGESPVLLKEGLNDAAEFVIKEIEKISKPVTSLIAKPVSSLITDKTKKTDSITNKTKSVNSSSAAGIDNGSQIGTETENNSGMYAGLEAIAVNSCANADDGKMVARAVSKVGANGIITIEENKNGKTVLNFADGLKLPCELASPYFCDDAQMLLCTFEDARVFITGRKILSVKEILPFLESAARGKFPLVIIADDFAPEVVSALVINKVRAGIRVSALRCGFFADRRDAVLGDLAALTGAEFTPHGDNLEFDSADNAEGKLGRCGKVIMGLEGSKFISHGGAALKERIELIKAQIDKCGDEYNKARLFERLAGLTGGVAVISVGCSSEIEQKEKRLRIEDALNAARAACAEGIVTGGGMALIGVKDALNGYIARLPKDKRAGAEILSECMNAPFRQICINADVNPDVTALECAGGLGFDARERRITDLFAANIVDPAMVVKSAVKNAVSVAGTLLTTEAVICN